MGPWGSGGPGEGGCPSRPGDWKSACKVAGASEAPELVQSDRCSPQGRCLLTRNLLYCSLSLDVVYKEALKVEREATCRPPVVQGSWW